LDALAADGGYALAGDYAIQAPDWSPRLTRPEAGVRAQAVLPDGALVDDFLIEETERSVHVLNAPSPAVAASLRTGIWEGPRSRTIRSSTSYAVMRRIFARLRRGVSDDQL